MCAIYVCVCERRCVFTYTNICICVYMYTIYVYIYIYMCMCVRDDVFLGMRERKCVCARLCTCSCCGAIGAGAFSTCDRGQVCVNECAFVRLSARGSERVCVRIYVSVCERKSENKHTENIVPVCVCVCVCA